MNNDKYVEVNRLENETCVKKKKNITLLKGERWYKMYAGVNRSKSRAQCREHRRGKSTTCCARLQIWRIALSIRSAMLYDIKAEMWWIQTHGKGGKGTLVLVAMKTKQLHCLSQRWRRSSRVDCAHCSADSVG